MNSPKNFMKKPPDQLKCKHQWIKGRRFEDVFRHKKVRKPWWVCLRCHHKSLFPKANEEEKT